LDGVPRTSIFIVSLATAIALISTILIILGELRLDVYISLYILAYYVLRALYSPFPRAVDRRLRISDVLFFIVFSIIVAYRVMLIIAPEVLMEWLAAV
jgi:hypothetical protein